MKILVINGPNLNLLGLREPEIYGTKTYADLVNTVKAYCGEIGVEVAFFQSNHEGDIIDEIQSAYGVFDGMVINPGGYTHTSIAIPDAIRAVGIPTVEVHISDTDHREEYRKISYIRPVSVATVTGKGIDGYSEAVKLLADKYESNN